MRASAQVNTLPLGCTDDVDPTNVNDGDGVADDGEVITCYDNGIIDPVSTDVDNLTILLPDAPSPGINVIYARDYDTTPAVTMDGDGDQSITIGTRADLRNRGSAEETLFIRSGDGNVTITLADESAVAGQEVAIQALVGNNDFGAFQNGADRSTGYDSSGSGENLIIDSDGDIYSTIQAQSTGSGDIEIDVGSLRLFDDYAEGTAALEVHAGYQVQDVNIEVGRLISRPDQYGIYARHYGLGDSTITTTGDIDTGGYGIRLDHYADGHATINIGGDITNSDSYTGVFVRQDGGTGLDIELDGAIDAGYRGIYAINTTGDVTIETFAASDVESYETAIYLTNSGDNTFISSSGDITSSEGRGIDLQHNGTGTATIYAYGEINAFQGDAVHVRTGANADDLKIETSSLIYTTGDGIDVINNGMGSTEITLAASSNIIANRGIYAKAATTTEDLTATIGGYLRADLDGIYANNYGTGSTTVTVQDGSEIIAGSQGVLARQLEYGEDLTVNIYGDVETANMGGSTFPNAVVAQNYGSGDTIANIDGNIVSQSAGILFEHGADGASQLNVNGVVSSANTAIEALNLAGTSMSIYISGDVETTDDAVAIDAKNGNRDRYYPAYGDFTFTTVVGSHIQAAGIGVVLRNFDYGEDLTLNIGGRIDSSGLAISSTQYGTGTHSLTTGAESQVYSELSTGIAFETHDTAAGADIELYGDVFSGTRAVSVRTYGDVETSISVHGRLIADAGVAGTSSGIQQVAGGGPVDLTVADGGFIAGDVSAANLVNAAIGLGITSIEVVDDTAPGGTTTIVLQPDTVSGFNANELIDSVLASGVSLTDLIDAAQTRDTGLTVRLSIRDDSLTLEAGGEIRGHTELSGGADTFNYVGGTFDRIFGGDDTDTVNFSGDARTFTNSGGSDDSVQEFEIFNFDNTSATTVGITLAGTHTGWEQANFNSGITILDGNLTATTATIAADATLNARDGALFTGALINNGTLDIGSSPGLFQIVGGFTQTSTGVLPIEVEGILFDQLYVDGTATLGGTLNVIASSLPTTPTDYLIIDTTGGISGAFDTITDNLPDLDVELTQSAGQIEIGFVAINTEDPDEAIGDDPGGESPQDGDNVDGIVIISPTPSSEPLLTAKEIAPSALIDGMHANDLFTDNLIQRRVAQATSSTWQAWGNGFGGERRVGLYDDVSGWNGNTGGFAIGAERLVTAAGTPVLFGLAGGFSRTSLSSEEAYSEIESVHVGGFASAELNRLAVSGALSYAWQEFDFERAINLSSGPVLAYGTTDGQGWALKAEGFYDLASTAGYQFGPLVTLDSTLGKYEGFEETNAGLLNLEYVDEHAYQTVTGLGAAGAVQTKLSGMALHSNLNIVWEHMTGNRHVTTLATLDVDGARFTPSSARMDANRVALGANALLHVTERIEAHIRYDTTQAKNFSEHAGWAGITLKF